MKRNLFVLLFGVAVLAVTAGKSVAAVSLTFSGTGYGASPFSVSYPTDYIGGSATRGSLFLGELIMGQTGGPNLRTYCLSPAGTVGSGLYDLMTFEAAKFGANPPTWSLSGGIENAAYLFHNFAGSVANNDQGAAMQLALMELIYDSTGLGTVTGSGGTSLTSGRFQASGVSGAVSSAVNNYINDILAAAGNIAPHYSSFPGYVLRPQAAGGQDLLVFIDELVPVPEASTMLAGALLLLPAGAMLLRRAIRRSA
jgi:hypothetical protein